MHRLLAIAALVLSLGIPSAEAAKRVALVIGNDSYKTLPDLNNARTDARGMAAKLKELGWSVILRQDASRRDIFRSLADFEGRQDNRISSRECQFWYQSIHRETVSDLCWITHQVV